MPTDRVSPPPHTQPTLSTSSATPPRPEVSVPAAVSPGWPKSQSAISFHREKCLSQPPSSNFSLKQTDQGSRDRKQFLADRLRSAWAWASALVTGKSPFEKSKNASLSRKVCGSELLVDQLLDAQTKGSKLGSTCGDVTCNDCTPEELSLTLPNCMQGVGLETGRFTRSFIDQLALSDGWFKSLQRFEDKWYKLRRITLPSNAIDQFHAGGVCSQLSALTSTAHRNVVRYITFWGEEDSSEGQVQIYLQAELGPARTLAEHLRHAPLRPNELFFIFSEVVSGLCYLHAKGVAHGALSLETVLVSEGEVQLADFGLTDLLEAKPATMSEDLAKLKLILKELVAYQPEDAAAQAMVREIERVAERDTACDARGLLHTETYTAWLRGVFASFDHVTKPHL